jgi:hypothetical protein
MGHGRGVPVSIERVTAVVMAGGFATRMNSSTPKALWSVAGMPLLHHTLTSLQLTGVASILVLSNRAQYLRRTAKVASVFPGTRVELSETHDSTFRVLCDVKAKLAPRCLFLYGHAPRPATHIAALLAHRSLFAVTTTASSSKRNLIVSTSGRFIEPPYVIDSTSLADKYDTWSAFLAKYSIAEIPLLGPHEFNDRTEFKAYREYVTARFATHGPA